MPRAHPKLVLAYRPADADRAQLENEYWGRVADVLVPVAYWTALAGIAAAFLGAVVLWGVLIAQAA